MSSKPDQAVRIPISFVDLRAAIRHDARISQQEGFKGCEQRANAILDRLEQVEQEIYRTHGSYVVEIVITPMHDEVERAERTRTV